MTPVLSDVLHRIGVRDGVYAPQADSKLLCAALSRIPDLSGARVVDVCTGSGVVAIQAAVLGAREVIAYDISAAAVECARDNAEQVGVTVDARRGSLDDAAQDGPYDLLVSNPPYVPSESVPSGAGLHRAWDAGPDGRSVLDALCTRGPELLAAGGSMLLVQSEFAGIDDSVAQLRGSGLNVDIVDRVRIPFGPVMLQRAAWFESVGLLEPGCRTEELVVLRGERRL